jgi:hypothetical protein
MSETPNEAARGIVSSYAIKNDERLLLFDPLAVPSEIDELAIGSDAVVVLTSPWHERDARSLVERFDAPVFTPAPDTGAPTSRGWWVATGATRSCMRPAIGCPSKSRRSPDGCPTMSYCGSRAAVR